MAKRNTETTNDTNRDDAAHAASEENSAQALTQRAFLALGVLDAELRTATAKLERKNDKPFEAFFAIMYAAIVAIDESGGTEAFLASHGIRANGNVKNPYFLMVRAFADSTCALLQGCKKAQVIQHGGRDRIPGKVSGGQGAPSVLQGHPGGSMSWRVALMWEPLSSRW